MKRTRLLFTCIAVLLVLIAALSVTAFASSENTSDEPYGYRNITLQADFVYNFYIPVKFGITEITVNGELVSLSDTATASGEKCYVAKIPVPAKNAAKEITIVYGGKTYVDSIVGYANDAMSAFPKDKLLVNVLKAVKDYTKAAAEYFGSQDIGYAYYSEASELVGADAGVPQSSILAKIKSATLRLDGELAFKFARKTGASLEGVSIDYYYNGTPKTYTVKSEDYSADYILIHVKAKDLLKPVTVKVGNDSYSYSLENYAYSMRNKYVGDDKAALLNLLNYIHAYAVAANECASDMIQIVGTNISEYSIYADSEKELELAEILQEAIYEASGKTLDIVDVPSENNIEIKVDNALFDANRDFSVSVSGKNLVISTWINSFASEGMEKFIDEYLKSLSSRLCIDEEFLLTYNTDKIYYSDFGAKGNLDVDALLKDVDLNPTTNAYLNAESDEAAIRATHTAANTTKRHTVYADEGAAYYIPKISSTIDIKTSCEFGNAKFYIDDRFISAEDRSGNINVFEIKNDYGIASYTASNDPYGYVAAINNAGGIKVTDTELPIKLGYDAMLILYNEDNIMYKRDGVSGSAQKELIVIDKNGTIDQSTKVLFDYEKVTMLEIVRIDTAPITFSGGEFTTVASRAYGYKDGKELDVGIYRGIKITRPNVVMDGFKHLVINEPIADLEPEKAGLSYLNGGDYAGEGPRYLKGFIEPYKTHNTQVNNAVLTGRAHYEGGSYDIGGELANKFVLTNCTQSNMFDENGVVYNENNCYWGIMGTNFCKNIEYIDCVLNRLDAHAGVYNFKVSGGEIAWIKVNGGGTGIIENVIIHSRSVFSLRSDYGSSWRGDFQIKNVVLNNADFAKDRTDTNSRYYYIFAVELYDRDYGFDTQMPNINVENISYVIYDYYDQASGSTMWATEFDFNVVNSAGASESIFVKAKDEDGNYILDDAGNLSGEKNTIFRADCMKITYYYPKQYVIGTYKSAGGATLKAQAVKINRFGFVNTTSQYIIKDGGFTESNAWEKYIEISGSGNSYTATALASGCTETDIIIPNFISEISSYSFANKNITSIVIPSTLKTVAIYAFNNCSNLTTVYYGGTESDWSKISVESGNTPLTNATRYYYSEKAPAENGNFWHFVDGVPTVWTEHTHAPGKVVIQNEIPASCTKDGSYDEIVYCSVCQEEISRTSVEVPRKPHTASEFIIDKAATCKEAGSKHTECTECHAVLETAAIDKLTTHTPAAAVQENIVEASCKEEGSYDEVVYCSVCDTEISRTVKTTEKLPHTPAAAVQENIVEASCKEEGSYDEVVYCSVCDAEISRTVKTTEKLPHTHGSAVIENEVEASCKEEGSYDEVVYCSVCDAEISRTVKTTEKLPHTHGSAVIENEVEASCQHGANHDEVVYCAVCNVEISRENVITTEKLEHIYIGEKCIYCGQNITNDSKYENDLPLDSWINCEHTPARAVTENTILPTCTTTGYYESVIYCSSCSMELSRTSVEITKKPHTSGDFIIDKVATCKEAGSKHTECTVCGEILQTLVIDKLAHIHSDPVSENEVEATCTNNGSYDEVVYCSSCHIELSRTSISVDALGHSEVTDAAVTPTCTQTGLTEGKHCSVCGETTVKQELVDALGHKAAPAVTENYVDSSCAVLGSYDSVVYCSVCQAEISRTSVEIAKKPHTSGDFIIDKVATCKEAGSKHTECTKCGEILQTLAIDKLTTHTLSPSVRENEVEATCTNNGSYDEVIYCSVCNVEISRNTVAIEKFGHSPDKAVEENLIEAGCTKNGSYDIVVYCVRCNFEFSRNTVEIPSNGEHKAVDGACKYCGQKESSPGLEYDLNADGTYTVTGIGSFTGNDLIIGFYNGYDVTGIAHSAFYGAENLTSVVISDSVVNIDDYAFYGCQSLANVTLPSGVIGISDYVFYNCTSLEYNEYGNAYYLGNSDNPYVLLVKAKSKTISSVTIHNNTKFIYYNAFYACENLTSVIIPDSVVSIGASAFEACENLTNISMPNTITNIGDYTFLGCKSISDLTIPGSVTSIGAYAFYDCQALKNIKIPDGIEYIGDSAFSGCTSLEYNEYDNAYYLGNSNNPYVLLFKAKLKTISAVTIHNDTRLIYHDAFEGCKNLTSVVIPENVISIGYSAFRACASLTSITVDEANTSYKSIDGNLYSKSDDCLIQYAIGKEFTNFTVPDGVKAIGDYAFYDCKNLVRVVIPNSVTSIGNSAFMYCINLTNVTIGNGVTSIADYAFCECKALSVVTMQGSVEFIGNSAFYGCESLSNIIVPDTVKSIGYSGFMYCSNLAGATIGNGLTRIAAYAFYGCETIANVYYSSTESNWENIGIDFENDKLTDATRYYYSESKPASDGNYWHYVFGVPTLWTYYSTEQILNELGLTYTVSNGEYTVTGALDNVASEILLPDGVVAIAKEAFKGNTVITKVTIPDTVTSLGASAFDGCSALEYVYVGKGITSVPSRAFAVCQNLKLLVFSEGLKSINSNYPFYNGHVNTIIILPSTVETLSRASFQIAKAKVFFNGTQEEWISKFGDYQDSTFTDGTYKSQHELDDYDGSNNKDNTGGARLYFYSEEAPEVDGRHWKYAEDGVTPEIWPLKYERENLYNFTYTRDANGNYTVTGLSEQGLLLSEITFPDKVVAIGNSAFMGNTNLVRVVIPDTVKTIGQDAFRACKALQYLTIGKGVTELPNNMLYSTMTLKEVRIEGSITKMGSNAFYNTSSTGNARYDLYLPETIVLGQYFRFAKVNIHYAGTAAQWKAIPNNTPSVLNGGDTQTIIIYDKDGAEITFD